MNFLALELTQNTETEPNFRNAYSDFVQPVLERFELLPEPVNAFNWDLHNPVVDFPQRVHLLLSFPSGAFLNDRLVCGTKGGTRGEEQSLMRAAHIWHTTTSITRFATGWRCEEMGRGFKINAIPTYFYVDMARTR